MSLSLLVLIHRFWLSRRGCEVLHISVDWKRTNDRKKRSLTHRHWSSFFHLSSRRVLWSVSLFLLKRFEFFKVRSSLFFFFIFTHPNMVHLYSYMVHDDIVQFFSTSWCRRCANRYFSLSLLQYNHIVLFDLAWLCLVRPLFKFIFRSCFVLENFNL